MNTIKSPVQSLTIVSAGTAGLVSLLGLAGVHLDPGTAGDATETVSQLLTAGLSLLAIYGRIRATARIGR